MLILLCMVVLKSLRRGLELRFLCVALAAHFLFLGEKMIITFCGHSDYIQNSFDEEKILSILEANTAYCQVDFYLGGYGNFDNFAYHCTKKYQALHPSARLIFITPYLLQRETKQKYDEIIYPSLENIPPKFALLHRNKWMIEHSDIVIAYVSRRFGGAYKSLTIAKHKNKQIFNIPEL